MDTEEALTRKYAETLDANDPLKHLRKEFIVPTKANLKSKTLAKSSMVRPMLYVCPHP